MRLHVIAAIVGIGLGTLTATPGQAQSRVQSQAQTYGQLHYHGAARGIGEARPRAYAATGDAATGYGRHPRPHPSPYASPPWSAGYRVHGHAHDRGGRYGYSVSRSTPRHGYRDDWGYQDDRPPSRFRSAQSWRGAAREDGRCDGPYPHDR